MADGITEKTADSRIERITRSRAEIQAEVGARFAGILNGRNVVLLDNEHQESVGKLVLIGSVVRGVLVGFLLFKINLTITKLLFSSHLSKIRQVLATEEHVEKYSQLLIIIGLIAPVGSWRGFCIELVSQIAYQKIFKKMIANIDLKFFSYHIKLSTLAEEVAMPVFLKYYVKGWNPVLIVTQKITDLVSTILRKKKMELEAFVAGLVYRAMIPKLPAP